MDTAETYLNDDIYVVLAGESPPEYITEARAEHHRKRVADPESPLVGPEEFEASPARDHHPMNEDVPVDGWVTFYDPEKLEAGEAFKHFEFPFRSVEKSGPWFARPDETEWSKQPVWKWQNPDADPHEHLTLTPSLGINGDDGIVFHCYIRDGEIDWL